MTDTIVTDYVLRKAKLDEVDYIVSMGERMHRESLFSHMNFDYEKTRKLIVAATDGNPHLFIGVIAHIPTEVPVGGLLAGISQTFFGYDSVANDFLVLLEPEHRGRCKRELCLVIDWYKTWAINAGAKRVYLSSSTGVNPEHTARLYEHCGFAQIGTLHEAGR